MIKVNKMFSKANKSEKLDPEQREQYNYARKRIKQKKGLMQHFIVFLVGSIFLIIMDPVMGIGKDFFIKNWFAWLILIWVFLLLVHLFNVFIKHKFMGKEWEDQQMEKLRSKQQDRIAYLETLVKKESQESDSK